MDACFLRAPYFHPSASVARDSCHVGLIDAHILRVNRRGSLDRQTGQLVAVKMVRKDVHGAGRGSRRWELQEEVKTMRAVNDANVVRLFDTFEEGGYFYLVTEYCDGGDLSDKVVERKNDLTEQEAATWVKQMCSAVGALHRVQICHRDVKLDNFMVACTSSQGALTLKLTDFGLATVLPKGQLLTDRCGTPAFMAPEMQQMPRPSPGYNHAIDMWAVGVCMFILLHGGKHPFMKGSELHVRRLCEGDLDFGESDFDWSFLGLGNKQCSKEARRVCQSMVNPSVERRLTAESALELPWLQQTHQAREPHANVSQDAPVRSASAPAPQTLLPAQNGALPPGTKCRYLSSSQGIWITTVVLNFDAAKGTYNLLSKLGAAPENMSPRPDVDSSAAWPPMTEVVYKSTSTNQWLPALIVSFNECPDGRGTYNLNIREQADVEHIRLHGAKPLFEL